MTTSVNKQPAIKTIEHGNEVLVHSIWQTIQGEGPLVGTPAVFIRLYGCNLMCPACDTDYTSNCHSMSFDEITDVLASYDTKLVVLSGGEPMRQAILPEFIQYLLDHHWQVQVETNGTLYQPVPLGTWITISPKGRLAEEWAYRYDDRLFWKYVVQAGEIEADGLPAKALCGARPDRPPTHTPNDRIYIQPLDEKDEVLNQRNAELAARICMERNWRLSMQIHKLIPTIE